MNDPRNRKRMIWAAAIAGVLLCSLLFISLLAPSTPSASDSPVIRTADQANFTGGDSTPVAGTSESTGFNIGGGQAVSLAWRLLLVAIIIAVSIFGLRWWGKKTSGPRSGTGFLRILDTLAISNGRTIHLVAVGDRVIAVGATAQQISFLNELTDDEATHLFESIPKPGDQPMAQFATELFQSMRRKTVRRQPLREDALYTIDETAGRP